MNKIDKQKVLEFQAKIVDKLLDADRECFRLLRKQFEQITVADMEGDSAGFFMYYSHKNVDPKYRLDNIKHEMIADLYLGYRNIFNIGDFLLYVIRGYIDCLECAWNIMDGFDGDWPPKDYEGFHMYYLLEDPTCAVYADYAELGHIYSTTYRDYSISVNKLAYKYLTNQANAHSLALKRYARKYKHYIH